MAQKENVQMGPLSPTDQVAMQLQGWEWWSCPHQAGPKLLESTIPPRYYGLRQFVGFYVICDKYVVLGWDIIGL